MVHLFGRLDDGTPFLVRDDRATPHFFIRRDDVGRALGAGITRVVESPARTLDDDRLTARVEGPIPAAMPAMRTALAEAGVVTYEADVRFALRYLMQRGVRASLRIAGPSRDAPGLGRVWHNPTIAPDDWDNFRPRVLSFDIETDPRARQLYSIGLAVAWGGDAQPSGAPAQEDVLLWSPDGLPTPAGARGFATERALLTAFVDRVRAIDPDVLIGWNVIDFDLRVLERIAQRCGVALRFGRGGERARTREGRSGQREAVVPGRVVLDGPATLRGAFLRYDRYGLDAVARRVLGDGKRMTGDNRGLAIDRAFREDRAHLVDYNRHDAALALRILEHLDLIALTVMRSRLTGLPMDRVQGAVAALDFRYLSALHRAGVVAPTVGARGRPPVAPGVDADDRGGAVFEPVVGLHRDVHVFDFRSLYPTLIRTFQLDPRSHVTDAGVGPAAGRAGGGDDWIRAPSGAAFRRAPRGLLPSLLDELMPRRAAALEGGRSIEAQAIKILMNSFYGVLGTSTCRFWNPALASAITAFGRALLGWTRDFVEARGHRVLYGDTDSLFVQLADAAAHQNVSGAADAAGAALAAEINVALTAHIADTWRVESHLTLVHAQRFRQLLLPSAKSGGGARKRYAGLLAASDDRPHARDDAALDGPAWQDEALENDEALVFIGMEATRRDAVPIAQRVQRALCARLFHGRPIAPYLTHTVADLRAGKLDPLLIHRRRLRKKLDDYAASGAPHVVAARKLPKPPRREIRWVFTTAGPEPLGHETAPPDRERYVQRTVRSVAAPVLDAAGLSFEMAVGDPAQLSLFGDG
ncbi:MAG: DNA polymerase domain-containing protein [Acidobacteriota bacterium]